MQQLLSLTQSIEHEDRMNQQQPEKKKYETPKVSRFPLRPDEAVLGFCKTASSSGPSGVTCKTVQFCRTAGS